MQVHAFRLSPGLDLKAEVERLARGHDLAAGFVLTCVGSLAQARLRAPGLSGAAEAVLHYDEPTEILALSGTLGSDGVHLHIALSRADGSCVGGHLLAGCLVHTTAELVIGALPEVVFRRGLDPATGYPELQVRRRNE